MKLGRDQPIQFVGYDADTKKFNINQDILEMVREIKGPIAVISVAGTYRSGKSFLTNRMLLNRKQGFRVSSTIQPETKGIWIWGKPILGQTSKNQTINVLILDTEGLSSLDRQSTYDMKIITMSILLSSLLIYNSVGAIQKNHIQTLYEVLQMVDKVSGKSYNSCSSLYWVLRDFSLELKSNQRILLNPLQYLQKILNSSSNAKQSELIRQRFNQIQCASLVRPLVDENSLQYLDIADYESLAPEFVDQLIQLRRKILNNIAPKQFNTKILDGSGWADMVMGYINQLNGNKFPQLANIWEYICQQECSKHSEVAITMYSNKLKQLSKKQLSQEGMKTAHKQSKALALEYMRSKCKNNSSLPQQIDELKKAFTEEYVSLMKSRQKQHFQQIKQLLSFQYQSVQRKLKLKEICTLWDYKKQIQMFTQFAKKKALNNISKQYVAEFINKKVFETITAFYEAQTLQFETKKIQLVSHAKKLEQQSKVSKKKDQQQKTQLLNKLQKALEENKQWMSQVKLAEQSMYELKNNKEQSEKQYWKQLLDQKSSYQKTINQLKAKLSLSQNTADEINREKIILESQLKKKDILYSNATSNSDQVLKQQKDSYHKLLEQFSKLKQSYHNQIKLSDSKFSGKQKEYLSNIESLKATTNDYQIKISQLEQKSDILQKRNRLLEEERKQLSQQLYGAKVDVEYQSKQFAKKIAENKFKLQKIPFLQHQISTLTQENNLLNQANKQLNSDLQKERAINQQKLNFIEIDLQEHKLKNANYEQKFKEILTSFNSKQLKLEQELTEFRNRELQLRKTIAMQGIAIDDLEVKNKNLLTLLDEKDDEISNNMRVYKQKLQNLQHSKILLDSQIRQIQSENFKTSKINERNSEQQIQRLNHQIERAREEYQNDVQDIKMAFQQTLEQIRSLHEIEKTRMENKLNQQKNRKQKKSSGVETQEANRNIRESNQRLQDELLQLKKKTWYEQKQYKLKVNELESKLTMRNSEIQQMRNNTTINIGSYKQNDVETKILKMKVAEQRKDVEQKNMELKKLTIQNLTLNESLKSRMEEIKKVKMNSQTTIHKLESELQMKKQEVNLLQIRINEATNDNSQFKKSIFSKQESILKQHQYLQSKLQSRNQSPPRTADTYLKNSKVESKIFEALKEIETIQGIYDRAVKQIEIREDIHNNERLRFINEKKLLQRKLQMMADYDI